MSRLLYVESLMRQNYEAVGFIPRPRLEEYAARGQVLVAEENDEPCGFLVFGNGWPALRIYQACIQYDARRREQGLRLVGRVRSEAQRRGCHLISLWCADDLEANEFWKAAGFIKVATRRGGTARTRWHNEWVMAVETEQMALEFPAMTPDRPTGPATDWMSRCPKCGLRIGTLTRMLAHLRNHRWQRRT